MADHRTTVFRLTDSRFALVGSIDGWFINKKEQSAESFESKVLIQESAANYRGRRA